MTALTKPVKRRTVFATRDTSRPEPIVVTLYPGGMIGLRRAGTRKEVRLALDAVWSMAWKIEANELRKTKAAAKRAKKGEA